MRAREGTRTDTAFRLRNRLEDAWKDRRVQGVSPPRLRVNSKRTDENVHQLLANQREPAVEEHRNESSKKKSSRPRRQGHVGKANLSASIKSPLASSIENCFNRDRATLELLLQDLHQIISSLSIEDFDRQIKRVCRKSTGDCSQ